MQAGVLAAGAMIGAHAADGSLCVNTAFSGFPASLGATALGQAGIENNSTDAKYQGDMDCNIGRGN